MKKLAFILAIVMIISAAAICVVSADEVTSETEGLWETRLDAFEEYKISNGEESSI